MWKQRVIRATMVTAAVFVVAAMGSVWLWRDRPSLEATGWSMPPGQAENPASVTATWLGVTTLLFDDGETQILIDGFFSRPTLVDSVLRRPVTNNAVTINYALYEYRMRRLAAIIPVHSHFDHAMDVGAVAKRTSASILGSESTANIARGAGVPDDQIVVSDETTVYEFGEFKVRLLPSRHAPIGWRGSPPLPGTIDEPLELPKPVTAWREGGSYTIVIEHPQGTALVQGSAGFVEGLVDEVAIDVAMLSIGGLTTLDEDYAEQYWQAFVTATGASSVYPLHFDDFTKPFGVIVPGPRAFGDLEETSIWFDRFRDTWDQDVTIYLPEFGKPMALYTQPSSST